MLKLILVVIVAIPLVIVMDALFEAIRDWRYNKYMDHLQKTDRVRYDAIMEEERDKLEHPWRYT